MRTIKSGVAALCVLGGVALGASPAFAGVQGHQPRPVATATRVTGRVVPHTKACPNFCEYGPLGRG